MTACIHAVNSKLQACAQIVDMEKKKVKEQSYNVALRVPESLHKPARIRIAALNTSFQAVLMDLLWNWVGSLDAEGEPMDPAYRDTFDLSAVSADGRVLVDKLIALLQDPNPPDAARTVKTFLEQYKPKAPEEQLDTKKGRKKAG